MFQYPQSGISPLQRNNGQQRTKRYRRFQYPQSGISPLQPKLWAAYQAALDGFSTLSRVLVLCNWAGHP